jgi:hypothetical protein
MSEKNNDLVWSKFLGYLQEMAPRVYIPKGTRILLGEALKASPNDVRLQALEQVFNIIARPEAEKDSKRFTF